MKKSILVLFIVFISVILSAEACWGNGVPVFTGNQIFKIHTCKTSDNFVFGTWTELVDQERVLKFQKYDFYSGEEIFAQSIQVSDFEGLIINDIQATNDGGCIISYSENGSHFVKVDSSGGIAWQQSIESSDYQRFSYLVTDENNIFITSKLSVPSSDFEVTTSIINSDGEVILEHNLITTSASSYNYIMKQSGEQIICADRTSETLRIFKTDLDGNLIDQIDVAIASGFPKVKFMNDCVYVSYYYDSLITKYITYDGILTVHDIDTNFLPYSYNFEMVDGEDSMYFIYSNDDWITVINSTYEGENNYSYQIPNLDNMNFTVFDADTDFLVTRTEDHEIAIYTLGISAFEDQFIIEKHLEDNFLYPYNLLSSNNDVFFLSHEFGAHENIYGNLFNLDNGEIESFLIKNIRGNSGNFEMRKIGDEICVFWFENNSLMKQLYDQNGNPQIDEENLCIIEGIPRYESKILDDLIVSTESSVVNGELFNDINVYDLSGEFLWGHITDNYLFYYDGWQKWGDSYFILGNIGWTDVVYPYYIFDESGITEFTLDFEFDMGYLIDYRLSDDYFYFTIQQPGNVFSTYRKLFYADGTLGESEFVTDGVIKDLYSYHNKEILYTADDYQALNEKKLRYYLDGTEVWDEPLHIVSGNIRDISMNDTNFMIKGDMYNVFSARYFDYSAEEISYVSFQPTDELITYRDYFVEDNHYFFISQKHNSDLHITDIGYEVYSENGEILRVFQDDELSDRPYRSGINQYLADEDCFYVLFYCGYKYFEGYGQGTTYIQKVDISEFTPISDEDIPVQQNNIYAYPNPFNPTTTLNFSLSQTSSTEITIYNIKGQKVKKLLDQEMEKGNHQIQWNGTDEAERKVSSGVYFYQLQINGKTEAVNKCLMIK